EIDFVAVGRRASHVRTAADEYGSIVQQLRSMIFARREQFGRVAANFAGPVMPALDVRRENPGIRHAASDQNSPIGEKRGCVPGTRNQLRLLQRLKRLRRGIV